MIALGLLYMCTICVLTCAQHEALHHPSVCVPHKLKIIEHICKQIVTIDTYL